MYDDRDRLNDDHVQIQSSRYFSNPRSNRVMKRSNAPKCYCEFCRSMRSMRKRQAYNSRNSRTPQIIYHNSNINSIKEKNDEPNSEYMFSDHARHARHYNIADEWKSFETDMAPEDTTIAKKADIGDAVHEMAQKQLKELMDVEQKIDNVTIKPI